MHFYSSFVVININTPAIVNMPITAICSAVIIIYILISVKTNIILKKKGR